MNAPLPPLLRKLGTAALELLVPPRCHGCGKALWGFHNPFLCPECIGKIEWIGKGACKKCGYPAGKYAAWSDSGCARCKDRNLGLKGVASVARYKTGAKNFVRALKFTNERTLVPAMGALMAERARETGIAKEIDLVAPLPLHPKRLRSRGFDQAALLAETVAKNLGAEYGGKALQRVRETTPQALMRRAKRLTAMEGAFAATEALVKGRTILLVDDVLTTGTTMSAGAKACRAGGAANVYGVTFAR